MAGAMAAPLSPVMARVPVPTTSTPAPANRAAVNGGDSTAGCQSSGLGGRLEVNVDLHHLGKGGVAFLVQYHSRLNRSEGGTHDATFKVVNHLLFRELGNAEIFE